MFWRLTRLVEKVNKARIRMNKKVDRFVTRNGGLVIRHLELKVDTFG